MRKILKALYRGVTSPFILVGLVYAAIADGFFIGRQVIWGQFLRWYVEVPSHELSLPPGYASRPGDQQ